VPESKIVETLIDEAMRLAEQAMESGAEEASGQPIVTVS
jgi:(E)-4-hydroxy-3-methylbut-2-enyl-diphosphate synthase